MKTLTLAESAGRLGISKQAAQKAARAEKWNIIRKVGNVYLYDAQDVYEYRDHGYRTRLAKELGWAGRGKFRDDQIDIECPECGAFAIEWPAMEPTKFRCLKGHEGKLWILKALND